MGGWIIRTGPVRWLITGLVVGLFVGLMGSIAYAATPWTGIITGCVSTSQFGGQHLLTLLDTAQSTMCQAGQTLITSKGPKAILAPRGLRVLKAPKVTLVLLDRKDHKVHLGHRDQLARRGRLGRLGRAPAWPSTR